MTFSVSINNCPEYAKNYKYIIARNDAGSLWFYGAFNNEDDVNRIVPPPLILYRSGAVCVV